MESIDRNYVRALARQAGHYEALDFIDTAPEYQIEDMARAFERELEVKTEKIGWCFA